MELQKKALCAFDDKRLLHEDGINSFAYVHKDITAGVTEVTADEHAQDLVMSLEVARRRNLYVGGHFRTPLSPGVDPAAAVAQAQVNRAGILFSIYAINLSEFVSVNFYKHFL